MGLAKINDMRKHIGMSIDELSEKSGVPKGTLSKITGRHSQEPQYRYCKSNRSYNGFYS